MKSCIIIPYSPNYVLGVNALLNSLDRFNTTEVHLLYHNIPCKEYDEADKVFRTTIQENPNLFNFKVEFIGVEEIFENNYPKEDKVWQLKYSRWAYTIKVQEEFDSVCILDGDMLCFSNLTPYLELANQSKIVLVAWNGLYESNWKWEDKTITPYQCNFLPYTNIPCFISPSYHIDLLQRIYDLGVQYPIGDMPAMTFALRDCDSKVITLPDHLWVRNKRDADVITNISGSDYTGFLASSSRDKISMIHGKFWDKGFDYVTLSDIGHQNFQICSQLCKVYNTNYKINLSAYFPENIK